MPAIEEQYIKTGKIRYYVRDFPLNQSILKLNDGRKATHCADEFGAYWELRAVLFTNQSQGNTETVLHATVLSSHRSTFDRFIAEARYAARVGEDLDVVRRLGISGTPEFLVGYLDPSHPSELKCVRRLSGAVSIDDFEAAIESVPAAELEEAAEGQVNQSTQGDRAVAESYFRASIGQPVPAVRSEDVRRVWSFLSSTQVPGESSDLKILADLCEPNANVLAVFFRATLVETLVQCGRLDGWREGSSLRAKVFEVAASFPLPQGPENADLTAFIAALQ